MATATKEAGKKPRKNSNALGDAKPLAEAILGQQPENAPQVVMLDPDEVEASPWQPRTLMDEPEMIELTEDVRERGVRQPVTVRIVEGKHHLVFGHRRKEAARRAGKPLPCIIRTMTDQEAAEEGLIENLQRSNLNPIDEARGYRRLIDEFKLTQQEVGNRVHRSQSVVANALRLLDLPEDVQKLVGGDLTFSHGLALCVLDDDGVIQDFAHRAVQGAWTVKALEAEISAYNAELQEQQQPSLPTEDAEDEPESENAAEAPAEIPVDNIAGEVAQCRVCGKNEAEVEANDAHMTKFDLCSACDPEAQAAEARPEAQTTKTEPTPAPVKEAPLPQAKKPKADEFTEGDGVQWLDGNSHAKTGIIAEAGKALYFVQPTGSSGAKARKTFQKKPCILKSWDKKSVPTIGRPDPNVKTSVEAAQEPANAKITPSPAPVAPAIPAKVPEGYTWILAPEKSVFACQDAGLGIDDVFDIVAELVKIGQPFGLGVPDMMTTIKGYFGVEETAEETAEESAEATTSDAITEPINEAEQTAQSESEN